MPAKYEIPILIICFVIVVLQLVILGKVNQSPSQKLRSKRGRMERYQDRYVPDMEGEPNVMMTSYYPGT